MAQSGQSIDYTSMFSLLQAWDTDNDGLVTADEFKRGLTSIGFAISSDDAETLCRALDTDGTGNIRIDSLAELLEPPTPPGGSQCAPSAPSIPAPPSLDTALGSDGLPSYAPSAIAPELRAWEALAAADPAAAEAAIAALPDDQAQALHAALGAAAQAQQGRAEAHALATGGAPYVGDDDDPMDSASLAAAQHAHRAMYNAAPTPQQVIAQQGIAQQGLAQQGMAQQGMATPAPGALRQPAIPMVGGMAMPPPQQGAPQPPPAAEYDARAAESAPHAPPMLQATDFSQDMHEGSCTSRPLSAGPDSSRPQRRRSFGSLATRFSLRSAAGGSSGNLLSADLDGAQTLEQMGALPLPTTPAASMSGDRRSHDGPPSGFEPRLSGNNVFDGVSLPSGPQSVKDFANRSDVSGVSGLPRPASRQSSFAQLSRLGSRSSLSVSFHKTETLYRPQDLATLPQKLGELLLGNHARAIDLFRGMDTNGDGVITRAEFGKSMRSLGLFSGGSPTGGRAKSPGSRERDIEREIDEIFATFDHNGDGSLDYEELHRLLRVGQNARMSEYLRSAVHGKSLPPQTLPFSGSYTGPALIKPMTVTPRSRDPAGRSGPGISLPVDSMPEIREDAWPPLLRGILVRERERVIDLFRHWEGVGEGGKISSEHFKAGLYVLGHRVSKGDVSELYSAMGVADGAMLRFGELRRQLRVVANRGTSAYLRAATKQGLELEASQPRGSLASGVGERLEATSAPTPQENILAALGLASTTHSHLPPSPPLSPGRTSSVAGANLGMDPALTTSSRGSIKGGLMGGMTASSHYSDGVVGLGADASMAKDRALEAAAAAAKQATHMPNTLLNGEMWLQQWARSHYSALLPELRKWELYPDGMITFDVFADSLHTLAFPAHGRWSEVEAIWYSWEPDEQGRAHWQNVRAHMTGGRLVRVQHQKHNTVSYYKQASRAGEGFGNRSSSRFIHESSSFVGPGKYTPDPSGANTRPSSYTGGNHSGKLKSTGPRFQPTQASAAPGPGKYTPRHTLVDSRHEIPERR